MQFWLPGSAVHYRLRYTTAYPVYWLYHVLRFPHLVPFPLHHPYHGYITRLLVYRSALTFCSPFWVHVYLYRLLLHTRWFPHSYLLRFLDYCGCWIPFYVYFTHCHTFGYTHIFFTGLPDFGSRSRSGSLQFPSLIYLLLLYIYLHLLLFS